MTGTGLRIDEYIAAESKSLTTGSAESSPCSALDCLLKDLLAFYVAAEKVYWHLQLVPAVCVALRVFPSGLREICAARPSRPFR